MNVASILVSIRQLFNEPNTAHSLNVDIAKHCAEDPEGFKKVAREWTQKYALEGGIGSGGGGGGGMASGEAAPSGANSTSSATAVATTTAEASAVAASSNSAAASADASVATPSTS